MLCSIGSSWLSGSGVPTEEPGQLGDTARRVRKHQLDRIVGQPMTANVANGIGRDGLFVGLEKAAA